MKPTDEEKRKFQKFDGDPTLLGPADRFTYAVLGVPNAWLRLEAMLYKAQFKEEFESDMRSLETLKVKSHLFTLCISEQGLLELEIRKASKRTVFKLLLSKTPVIFDDSRWLARTSKKVGHSESFWKQCLKRGTLSTWAHSEAMLKHSKWTHCSNLPT